jgi:hypothetical protein
MKPCRNHATCLGFATDGDLCHYCREVEERMKREEENRWLWAGFKKSTDNHRRGYKKGAPK